MSDNSNNYPDWLVKQRGRRYRSGSQAGYMTRHEIIRDFAQLRAAEGNPATFPEIKQMLEFLDRGYALRDDQISANLAASYRAKTVPKQPRGIPVVIEGIEYRSARTASEAIGVSHQTVRRRIVSDAREWDGWSEKD